MSLANKKFVQVIDVVEGMEDIVDFADIAKVSPNQMGDESEGYFLKKWSL